MADALINMDSLANFIKCSICLDKFDNPKMLRCKHVFCKECLKGVIHYYNDGSALITCPMRCAARTIVGIEETLDDLPLSYEFKGMLEVLKTEEEKLRVKQQNIMQVSTERDGDQAFFDITIDRRPAGRIIMNLFKDVVPETCRNFIQLCTHEHGVGYKGSKFHWIVTGLFSMGGGIFTKGDTRSKIFELENENFDKKHVGEGVLSLWSSGGYTTSIFFISTQTRTVMDGIHVVIGKVTEETYHIAAEINAVKTGDDDKPCKDVVIVNCGVL